MDNINGIKFGYEMQQEIERLGYLPKEQAISLLGMYLSLSEDNNILQSQLIYAIQSYGEYINIDKSIFMQ